MNLDTEFVAIIRRLRHIRQTLKIEYLFDRSLSRHLWLVSPTKVVSYASKSSYITATSDVGTVTFGVEGTNIPDAIKRALWAFTSNDVVTPQIYEEATLLEA